MANEGPQLDLIDYTNLGKRQWWLRHLPQLDMFELLVLRAIDDKARGPHWVSMTRREIAAFWNGDQKKSLATVSRAVKSLEDAGLLFSEPDVDGRGQRANRYKIAWANVKDIANGKSLDGADPIDETEETLPPPPSLTAKGSTLTDKGPFAHSEWPLICERSPTSYSAKSAKSNKSLLLLPSEEKITNEQAAAEILKFVGMDSPMTAIRTALGAGATLAEFHAIADYYRSQPDGRWQGPGAVHHKLMQWHRGQSIETGWPRPDPKWLARQRSMRDAFRAAQARQERDESKLEAQQAVDELESRHGPILDAMSDAEVLRMIRQAPGGQFNLPTWRKTGRESRSLRRWLLSQLERNSNANNDTPTQCGAAGVAAAE